MENIETELTEKSDQFSKLTGKLTEVHIDRICDYRVIDTILGGSVLILRLPIEERPTYRNRSQVTSNNRTAQRDS